MGKLNQMKRKRFFLLPLSLQHMAEHVFQKRCSQRPLQQKTGLQQTPVSILRDMLSPPVEHQVSVGVVFLLISWPNLFCGGFFVCLFGFYFFLQPHVAAVMHLPPWACWKQEYVFSQTTLRSQSSVPSRLYLAASILRVSTVVHTKLSVITILQKYIQNLHTFLSHMILFSCHNHLANYTLQYFFSLFF